MPIDGKKLSKYISEGKTQIWCAKKFGVTRAAISLAVKRIKKGTTKQIIVKRSPAIVERSINSMDQLKDINRRAIVMLDELERNGESPETRLKIMAEIRGQLKLQQELFTSVYDVKFAMFFNQTILETIAEESPDVRDRIVAKLRTTRSLFESIRPFG